MKNLKTFFATLVLLLCCGSASAHDFEADDIYYNITDSSDLTVEVTYRGSHYSSYNEYTGNVIIPESVTYDSKNYSVTSIGSSAFRGCSSLTSVTIPNGVTSIGDKAFSSCSSLISVTIPNGVTSIGEDAFQSCSSLTSVTIPNSVTSIGEGAFSYCNGLTSITIPNSVTSIGRSAFCRCNSLTSINIPNGVTSIGEYAFQSCSSLTSVTIPNSVTSIGSYAFCGCSSLTSVTIPNGVTSIGDKAFSSCSSLISVTIPNGVTSIGSETFYDCSNLTTVTIGNSVTSIGDRAFYKCRSLTSVTIPDGVTSIGSSAFSSCSSLTSVTIPNSVTSIGGYAFWCCSSLTSVTIPDGVTSIGDNTFTSCSSLTSVTIGNGVTSIGNYAFTSCSSLTSVTIGNSVTSIGENAFSGCSSLTSVTIPDGVTSIGDYTFLNCSSLTSVTIGDGVTSIGKGAFYNCRSLTSVTIPDGVTSIGSSAFSGCSGLTSVHISDIAAWCNIKFDYSDSNPLYYAKHLYMNGKEITELIIPDGVTSISSYAFYDCDGLTSVTIPNSVTSIGDKAFYSCNSLTSVTIGSGVTSIGNSAFSGCSSLTSVTIGSGVTSIGNSAFSYCSGLTSVHISDIAAWCNIKFSSNPSNPLYYAKHLYMNGKEITELIIPDGVTSISSYAFYDCDGLTSVTIPNSVTSIGDKAFYSCSSLTSVTIPYSVTSIGDYTFYNCSNLTSVTIPDGVTSIGKGAFNYTAWYNNQPDGLVYAGKVAYKYKGTMPSNTSIELAEGTLGIAAEAFENCGWLTSVTIPNSVTSIGTSAFYGCMNIDEVTSYIIEPFGISNNTFDFSNENFNAILFVPDESVQKYEAAEGWKNFKTIIHINNGSSLALKVIDNKNNDITNDVNITWYDSDNTQIGTGKSLNGIEDSTTLYYSVQLKEELGRIYREVDMRKIIVDADTIICQLEEIERIMLEGRVSATDIDKATVTVNVKQMLNGKYEQTYSTETNEQGTFKVEIYDDNTDITISGDGYLDATLHRDGFNGNGSIGTIPLNLISGFAISANLTQNKAVATGETKETEEWSGGLNNIEFELYNITKSSTLSDFTTQNGNIIIKTGAEVGDEIRLTAKSKQGIFADATTTFTIEDGSNGFELVLTELGGIDVTYTSSNNSNTIGYLYDANSRLVAKGSYVGEKLSLRHLHNGTYTLVSMGSSTLLGNLPNLANLSEVGLNEGNDYVTTSVVVANGILTETTINEVPRMDDTRFYYTSSNTYFNANKESLTSGNYLTLSAHLDFKPEYSEKADVVNLSIEIPEGCQVVENSVIANRKYVAHTIDGNCLKMTLNKEQWQGQIRFCVIPLINKTYTLTAIASFDIDGSISQPIGTVQFEAKGLSLNTPKYAANKNIIINGTAIGHSEISIYDNDVLIGKTTSKADGSWTAECELFKPYSYSFHDIYAKITTENGMELTSETRKVVYDKNMPVPQKVTMTYYNRWCKKNMNVEYNLIDGTVIPASYQYTGTDFTFLAEFSRNDSTIIKNVSIKVLNSDGTVRTLPATFDGKQNCWVATTKYSSSSKLPMNVSVDYDNLSVSSLFDKETEVSYGIIQNNMLAEVENAYKDCKIEFNTNEENSTYFTATTNEYGTKEKFRIVILDYQLIKKEYEDDHFYHIINDTTDLCFVINAIDNNNTSLIVWDNKAKRSIAVYGLTGYNNPSVKQRKIIPFVMGAVLGVGLGVYEYNIRMKEIQRWHQTIELESELYSKKNQSLIQMLYAKCPDGSYKIKSDEIIEFDLKLVEQWQDLVRKYLYDFEKVVNNSQNRLKQLCILKSSAYVATSAVGAIATGLISGAGAIVASSSKWAFSTLGILLTNSAVTVMLEGATQTTSEVLNYNLTPNESPNQPNYVISPENIISNWHREQSAIITRELVDVMQWIKADYSDCNEETEEENNDEPNDNNDDNNDNFGKGATPIIDPSGYVYEAVLSNRLEGVTTTCYQKVQKEDMYGDVTEEVVMWNAADYSQQNPLKTDANGFYRWDVPQGMWQVKYEKEGYETVYSEWLPVPPPQLDVNVGMKQSTPPTVKHVRGYESGITIEMSKYMHPTTLNTTNVTITRNGMPVKGSIDILNLEKEPYGDAVFASKLKFIPETAFETTDEVMLTVHKEVESYCGVNMLNDYIQKIKIEPEIKEIVADSLISVPYQGTKDIQVVVLPKTASAGKTLRIQSSSSMITAINTEEIVLDENGSATLTLNGELPGSAFLTFTIDETDISKQSKVKVVTKYDMVAAPLASIKSGESVDAGTLLTLTCETEGATIYYTLDGSCPCDEAKRIKYEAPIAINSDVIVKAIAVREDMDDSDIATFVYMINATGIENIDMSGIKIWPYVTSSSIHIDLNDLKAENISVVNLDGATIYSAANVKGMITIDLGRYADGMYIVNVKCKDGKIVKKIIKINNH